MYPKLLEIAVAWKRAMKPTDAQQKIAEARLKTCNSCEKSDFRELIMTYVCTECGCPLNKKIYSPNGRQACPLGLWED